MPEKQLMIPDLEQVKALQLVDRMDAMLEEAEDWDSMMNVRNGTIGIAAMAGAMRMGEAAQKAKILQLKAERKAGGLLDSLPKHPGARNLGDTARFAAEAPKTMAEIAEEVGIGKRTLITWKEMSKVPDRLFHRWLDDMLKDGDEVSQRGFLRFIKPATPKLEEKPLSILDRWTNAIKELSSVAHLMGSPRTKAEAKQNVAYIRQGIGSLKTMLHALEELVKKLEAQ